MNDNGLWTYGPDISTDGNDLVGYDVEATDGSIGKVDASTQDADRQHIVVDTGFWIFGKRRLLPAGVVRQIDHDDQRVWVRLSKDQVRAAPDFDDMVDAEETRRRDQYEAHDDFYSQIGW